MNWTAVLPLRQGPEPKSRLASRLSPAQRIALSLSMARGVLNILRDCPSLDRIILLSPDAPGEGLGGEWHRDGGQGLNEELDALRARLGDPAMLVVHGDLPLVTAGDIGALISGAERCGHALAPDRHGTGTNAAAIGAGRAFIFAFGEGSLQRHLACAPGAVLVRRPGLAIDIDTPDDLDAAIAAGFRPSGLVGN